MLVACPGVEVEKLTVTRSPTATAPPWPEIWAWLMLNVITRVWVRCRRPTRRRTTTVTAPFTGSSERTTPVTFSEA
ncbi:MAG: hypothetical protein ACR2L9_08200 [Solirubrobacteraceae bacterium]